MDEIETFAGTVGISAYSHALMMVTKLPRTIHGNTLEGFVQSACIESWYTNMRLLCEFYDIGGSSTNRDYKAKAFAKAHVSLESKKELNDVWVIASKLVSHLSKDRNPRTFELDVDFSLQNMLRLSGLILEVSEGFENALKDNDSEYSALIHVANTSARSELNYGSIS